MSGTGTARTKPARQRRGELLDAAERLVLGAGAEALTVDDVTVGAGVAKGTFYLHFANKDDLLNALRGRFASRFAEVQAAAAEAHDGTAAVSAWLRAGVAEYLRDMSLHDVLFHPSAYDRDAPNPAVESLAELLGGLDPAVADPTATAVLLYSAMHGAADRIAHAPGDQARMLPALDRMCEALLAS